MAWSRSKWWRQNRSICSNQSSGPHHFPDLHESLGILIAAAPVVAIRKSRNLHTPFSLTWHFQINASFDPPLNSWRESAAINNVSKSFLLPAEVSVPTEYFALPLFAPCMTPCSFNLNLEKPLSGLVPFRWHRLCQRMFERRSISLEFYFLLNGWQYALEGKMNSFLYRASKIPWRKNSGISPLFFSYFRASFWPESHFVPQKILVRRNTKDLITLLMKEMHRPRKLCSVQPSRTYHISPRTT